MQTNKNITLNYFAIFREKAGRPSESVQTLADSPSDLYCELAERYGFNLASKHIRVAINDQFSSMDSPLNNGDTIVFIPPVSGG